MGGLGRDFLEQHADAYYKAAQKVYDRAPDMFGLGVVDALLDAQKAISGALSDRTLIMNIPAGEKLLQWSIEYNERGGTNYFLD